MKPDQIKAFLEEWKPFQNRTIVLVDFANVERWKESLGWHIGVRELANLVKSLSVGNIELRRFYYGSDYGPSDTSDRLEKWSETMLNAAKYNGLHLVTKRVKYMPDRETGNLKKKCDLDLEMFVDLIKRRKEYDRIVLFSGDGDLACALDFMRVNYKKQAYIFGARDHLGKELGDLLKIGRIEKILFAEDFEYRLSMDRKGR